MSHVTHLHVIDNDTHGYRLVSIGRDEVISFWDLSKFKLISTIPTYECLESFIYIDPSRHIPFLSTKMKKEHVFVMTGGDTGLLKIWNLSTCQCIYEEINDHGKNGIDYIIYDKIEQDMFIAITNEQNIVLYKYEDMVPFKTMIGYNDEIIDMDFIDENRVIVCSNSNELKIFKIPNFECEMFKKVDKKVKEEDENDNLKHGLDANNKKHGLDANKTVTDTNNKKHGLDANKTVTDTNNTVAQLDSTLFGHEDTILSLSLSHDKRYVITGGKDHYIFLWDILKKKSIAIMKGHASSVTDVQFFHKTNRYCISVSKDLTWKVWDLKEVIDKNEREDEMDVRENESDRKSVV